jgi:hypothetical protein
MVGEYGRIHDLIEQTYRDQLESSALAVKVGEALEPCSLVKEIGTTTRPNWRAAIGCESGGRNQRQGSRRSISLGSAKVTYARVSMGHSLVAALPQLRREFARFHSFLERLREKNLIAFRS